jgi:outer membrane protein TolC
LTLEDAVERAVERSLSLQISAIDLRSAQREAENRWAQFLPSLSVGGGVSYSTGVLSEQRAGQGDPLGYSLNFSASLRLNERLFTTMKQSKLLYQSRLFSYEQARRQVELEAARSYYSLLAEGANLSILEEVLRLAEREREKNRISFENGYVGQLAYLQSQLSAESAKLNLSRARTAYEANVGDFLVLLGFDQGAEAELTGTMEVAALEADPEALIREYLPRRPDVVTQQQRIAQAENARTQSFLSSRGPSVSLSASYAGSASPALTDSLSGSIDVAIPLDGWVPGSLKDQALRSARAEVEKARLELQNIENSARAAIRSLSANLRNSWAGIEIARLRVEIAGRTYELTEIGFQNGTVELLTLEDARNNLAEARQQLLSDELAYKTMTLDLAAALNVDWRTLSGGSL